MLTGGFRHIYMEHKTDPHPNARFSTRDLLMRYHWGIGVGHLHAHQANPSHTPIQLDQSPDIDTLDDPDAEPLPGGDDTHAADMVEDMEDSDNDESDAVDDDDRVQDSDSEPDDGSIY
jgi:hypothetical protein